jgi:hypothetical protein
MQVFDNTPVKPKGFSLADFFLQPYISLTVFIMCIYFLLGWLIHTNLLNEAFYLNHFAGSLEPETMQSMIPKVLRFNIFKTILGVFVPLVNIFLTTICLYLFLYFYNHQVSPKSIANSVASAYLIFIIPYAIKFVWFDLHPNFTLNQFDDFQAGAWLSVVIPSTYHSVITEILNSTFTAFEILFWVILTWRLTADLQVSPALSTRAVLLGYGAGLLMLTVVRLYLAYLLPFKL